MSKRHALRELKRQRMAARDGYKMHLLDLWSQAAFPDNFELPGQGSSHWRHAAKKRMICPVSTRP